MVYCMPLILDKNHVFEVYTDPPSRDLCQAAEPYYRLLCQHEENFRNINNRDLEIQLADLCSTLHQPLPNVPQKGRRRQRQLQREFRRLLGSPLSDDTVMEIRNLTVVPSSNRPSYAQDMDLKTVLTGWCLQDGNDDVYSKLKETRRYRRYQMYGMPRFGRTGKPGWLVIGLCICDVHALPDRTPLYYIRVLAGERDLDSRPSTSQCLMWPGAGGKLLQALVEEVHRRNGAIILESVPDAFQYYVSQGMAPVYVEDQTATQREVLERRPDGILTYPMAYSFNDDFARLHRSICALTTVPNVNAFNRPGADLWCKKAWDSQQNRSVENYRKIIQRQGPRFGVPRAGNTNLDASASVI